MKTQAYTLIVVLCLLYGCVANTSVQSIDGSPLKKLSAVDAPHLYAADPAGKKVLLSHRGLSLLDLETEEKQVVSRKVPIALAWQRDGRQFSAAFSLPDDQTLIAVYSATGALVREHMLPVVASNMVWSGNGDLLVAGYVLKVYSFGSNLQQSLAVIKGENFNLLQLTDATLKPGTTKVLKPVLQKVLPVLFSEQGDELIYVRLHDPPEFAPYLKVVYTNWQAGGARELLKLPLQAVTLEWLRPDLAEVRASGGQYRMELWPVPVAQMDSQRYSFQDGRLSQGQTVLADWGSNASFQLLRDGQFLLATDRALYLGSGLEPQASEKGKQNAWQLRRWRYQGLISPEEYQRLLLEDNK